MDIVKIDQGFVGDIGRDPSGAAIVEAVSNLAHVLGLSVTAEGVETRQQHDTVTGIGCERAQGFLYGVPVSAADVGTLLRAGVAEGARRSGSVLAASDAERCR